MVKSIDKSRKREYYRLHIISERNEYIMELPNNTHSSEAAKQMEFAEGFNPELTTEEKLQAAAEFDDLIQSTLLRFARFAKTYDHDIVFPGGVGSTVVLEIPQEDGSYVSVYMESVTFDKGGKKRFISIVAAESDGRGKESHNYYIEDGQVLRYDYNAAIELSEKTEDMYVKELSIEGLKHNIATLKNEIENDKLERQMGLNRQPVGVEEINKLAELLEPDEIKVFKAV